MPTFSSESARQPVISLENLCFSRQSEAVLENVSLRVDEGDFLAVLGPNGGGKTTLLRLIMGFLSADKGEVRVFGANPERVRSQIGYVPQFSAIRQEFPFTVLDMALMGAARYPAAAPAFRFNPFRGGRLWPTDAAAARRAMETLDLLGIADIAQSPLHALSGGQRQRLLVARALMGRTGDAPFLLLLDEPTSSIDPQGKWCFYEFLGSLRSAVTIVVVSHELAIASPFFSRVALVNRTLTLAPPDCPSSEIMRTFIGVHAPDCPVGQSLRHRPDCGCNQGGGL